MHVSHLPASPHWSQPSTCSRPYRVAYAMTSARTVTGHIGLLLFDDVEELDAVGPWEVLSNWTLHYPADGWSISTVSRDGEPVVAAKGLTMAADHSMSGMPPLGV